MHAKKSQTMGKPKRHLRVTRLTGHLSGDMTTMTTHQDALATALMKHLERWPSADDPASDWEVCSNGSRLSNHERMPERLLVLNQIKVLAALLNFPQGDEIKSKCHPHTKDGSRSAIASQDRCVASRSDLHPEGLSWLRTSCCLQAGGRER